ncbi:MAG: hypothetical protein AAF539_06570 [Planctomycetota bacterium]
MSLRCLLSSCFAAALAVTFATGEQATAQGITPFGFQAYGFYQPYGIQYRSSIPTPPYFSVSPPVYYGTRNFRPYGTSPFASPPVRTAPQSYQATPDGPARRTGYQGPVSNPFICRADSRNAAARSMAAADRKGNRVDQRVAQDRGSRETGRVQTNPFVGKDVTELVSL